MFLEEELYRAKSEAEQTSLRLQALEDSLPPNALPEGYTWESATLGADPETAAAMEESDEFAAAMTQVDKSLPSMMACMRALASMYREEMDMWTSGAKPKLIGLGPAASQAMSAMTRIDEV